MKRVLTVTLFVVMATAFPLLLVFDHQQRPAPTSSDRIELTLRPKELAKFQESLQRRRAYGNSDPIGRRWTRAFVEAKGERLRAKIRLRGDSQNHWVREKVSLRVRLSGERLYDGCREFNLIVPHDRGYFQEMCAEWWSRRLGLVPCKSGLLWVDRNGEELGIYAFVEGLGKEQLEREGRPFGPIFKSFARENRWLRATYENRRNLYSLPYFRQVLNDAPNAQEAAALLVELLRVFRENPSFDDKDYRRVGHLLDLDKLAAFSALSRLLGTHAAAAHNVILYFNSSTGLFEPVFQDPSGNGMTQERTLEGFEQPFYPESFSPFVHELLGVPAFHALRDRWLERILRSGPEFTAYFAGLRPLVDELVRDPLLLMVEQEHHPSKQELLAYGAFYVQHYRQALERIRAYLAQDTRGGYEPSPAKPLDPAEAKAVDTLQLSVQHQPAGAARVTLRHSLPTSLRLRSLTSDGLELRRWEAGLELPPRADTQLTLSGLDPAKELQLRAELDPPGLPLSVAVRSSDARRVDLSFLDRSAEEQLRAHTTISPRVEDDRLVIPAGSYEVRRTVCVPRGRRLVFEAGARLLFAPGAGLVSYAPLTIAGTAEQPVVLDELEEGRGWAGLRVVAVNAGLAEPAQRRSLVSHLVCARARASTLNGITSTGGLTFLGSDVRLERSVFLDVGGDDALNVKRATAEILECLFLSSPSDAVDLDWCRGRIQRSLFLSSGGDGIDLSGALGLEIADNLVVGCGDKGVSVGEASQAVLTGNLIAGCLIGVASKDRSVVASRGNALFGNETAFAAYQKKPAFGGGTLASRGDTFWGDTLRLDPGSRLERRDPERRQDDPALARAFEAALRAVASEKPKAAREALRGAPLPAPWRGLLDGWTVDRLADVAPRR